MTFIPRNRVVRIVCFLGAGFIFSLLMCGSLFRLVQAQESFSENVVYTESNIPTENGNTILGFSQDKIGNLTPLPNSPFPTGGAGIADPTFTEYRGVAFLLADNDQEVIVDHEHNRLFSSTSATKMVRGRAPIPPTFLPNTEPGTPGQCGTPVGFS